MLTRGLASLLWHATTLAMILFANIAVSETLKIQELKFEVPSEWQLKQNLKTENTLLLTFENQSGDLLNLYVTPEQLFSFDEFMGRKQSHVDVIESLSTVKYNHRNWQTISTKRVVEEHNSMGEFKGNKTFYTTAFSSVDRGFAYYGFVRAADQLSAKGSATNVLEKLY
jgi:hypothetical protein